MADETSEEGLHKRIARQGEDALGKLAQDLLENPLVHGALARAFDAREKAAQAQEVAMGALNIPSAADMERLTRRVRSVSQRLEAIEDGVDRVDERFAAMTGASALEARLEAIEKRLAGIEKRVKASRSDAQPAKAAEKRLDAIDERLGDIAGELSALRKALPDEPRPPVS